MKTCEMCGKALGRQRRFCSTGCRDHSMRRREQRVCPYCGETFECHPSRPKVACSDRCAGASRSGTANNRYNGGLSVSDGRTIIVHRDGTWTFYYRVLMEVELGRELTSDEIVHHVNGDPADDRIENLEIVTRAEHIEIHRADLMAGWS